MAGSPLLLSSLPSSSCASVPPGHQSDKSARLIDPISFVLCTYFRRERSCLLLDRVGLGRGRRRWKRRQRERERKDSSVRPPPVRPTSYLHACCELRGVEAAVGGQERERRRERGSERQGGREEEKNRAICFRFTYLAREERASSQLPSGRPGERGPSLGHPRGRARVHLRVPSFMSLRNRVSRVLRVLPSPYSTVYSEVVGPARSRHIPRHPPY